MAQLGALISFQAGTPAVANDVNNNFNLIRTFINSANFGVDNIDSTLSSRGGAPILTLEQVSEPFSPLYIINAQSKHAINIWQQASLDANQGVILINDTITQTTASTAALLMTLAAGSTNPAILIKHGTDTTASLTKTQLNLFNSAIQATSTSLNLFASAIQATSAGVVSATTGNFTTVNATTVNFTTGNATGNINTDGDIIYDQKYHVGPKFQDLGNQSGSYSLDLVDASIHKISLNAAGNLNLTLSNPVIGGVYILEIYHAVSNSGISWPASVKWSDGLAPNLSAASAKTDIISLIYNGSVYYGNVSLGF
jgi:hypothetical protein